MREIYYHIFLFEAKTLNLVYECPQGNTRTALHDMETIYDFIVEKSLFFFFAELLVSRTLGVWNLVADECDYKHTKLSGGAYFSDMMPCVNYYLLKK